MQRTLLKSKIHRVQVTDADLEYEGSLTIDEILMRAADIVPHEQVKVYNVNNGARFDTYAIPGPPGKGDICLNGAAARMGARGDLLIIATYGRYDESEVPDHQPKIVLVKPGNKPSDSV
ncbi:MAG: aspartate 1-decarboxylase [Syntrophobacteraceae bacterium]|jgi:aspartate 1-decarboxylase|nr:aspartate 1-decarboxylase [Syntrophobacteraceae bacterium]